MKRIEGDWQIFRRLPGIVTVDFHWTSREPFPPPYYERMDRVRTTALDAVVRAHQTGVRYVLLTHGWSTSRSGQETSRSVIRKLMKSADATPYIVRAECIQHESAFVAAIRPSDGASVSVMSDLESLAR